MDKVIIDKLSEELHSQELLEVLEEAANKARIAEDELWEAIYLLPRL